MTELMGKLGNPQLRVPAIHVAGSKGKGSVSHYLSWALQASGKTVGVYSSPHLSDWRERICVNGQFVNDEILAAAMSKVLDAANQDATFFDLLTATAFEVFAALEVDCMIIETGLGGKYDSTNVVRPLAAVITALELEHTDVLGDTLTKIAKEKGGIYKANTQLWCSENIEPGAKLVLHQIANSLGDELRVGPRGELSNPGLPRFVNSNRALAVAVLASLGGFYEQAAQELRTANVADLVIPGRFELRYTRGGRPVVFDVAHSENSLCEVLRCFRMQFKGQDRSILLALRDDKDYKKLAAAMALVECYDDCGENWYCCRAADHPRSARADKIAPAFKAQALAIVGLPKGDEPLLITGSTYLVGALRKKTIPASDVATI
jgi:dihydrofolate synthase/folylpolyglutamate synthase